MIKLKDLILEMFDRYWNLEMAKPIADELGATIVGSVSTKGWSNHDLDLRIEDDDIPWVNKILSKRGFECQGSVVVSPQEAKESGKPYGKGWQRAFTFIDPRNDKIIQIWIDEEEENEDQKLSEGHMDDDWNIGQRYDASDVLIYVQNSHDGFEDYDRVTGYFDCILMDPRKIPESPYDINHKFVDELSKTNKSFSPIVLDKSLDIIDGGHRLAAAVKRGDKQIKVLKQI